MSKYYTSLDHFALTPALLLALFGAAILLFDFFVVPRQSQKRWLAWLTVAAPTNTGGGSVAQITLRQDPICLDAGGGTVVFRSTMPLSFNTQEIRVEVADVGPCRRLYLPYIARACTTATNCAIAE